MRNKLYVILITMLMVNTKSFSSDFGTTGIISTPTARMMRDGDLKLSLSSDDVANITNFSYQATPWLELAFRYTIFDPNDIGTDELKDRSFGAKVGLLKESRFLPKIAIGARDILGTGSWASEYLVASKKINNFDFSLGLGWGRLSERVKFDNPIGKLNNYLYKRQNYSGGRLGGKFRSKSLFRGQSVGVFGGMSYNLPNYNLNFLAEYNSDSYNREKYFGTMPSNSPINYGIEWSPHENYKFGLHYKYGNQIGLSFSSSFATKYEPALKTTKPFYSSLESRDISKIPSNISLSNWYERLLYDVEKSGLLMIRASLNEGKTEISIEIENLNYNLTSDAINKFIKLANIHLPSSVQFINLILIEEGFRVISINYNRKSVSMGTAYDSKIGILKPKDLKKVSFSTDYKLPKLSMNIDLNGRVQLFDPKEPIRHQLFVELKTTFFLRKGLNIHNSIAYDIDNNFAEYSVPNSILDHVRTDINRYLNEGSSGIESLYMEKRSNLNSSIFYRAYLGILEQMYSGVGGEFLYNPFKKRWAVGGSINYVKKRGYKRNFDHLDYKTLTSFISLYYASPFYNYDLALHVGKYLAKDKGATIEVRRTFDNGFGLGIFATFTDVPSRIYGEGSFDKGLFFNIPFDIFSKNNNKSSYSSSFRSIQRDGGQRLDGFSGTIWHNLRNIRYDSLYNNKQRIIGVN